MNAQNENGRAVIYLEELLKNRDSNARVDDLGDEWLKQYDATNTEHKLMAARLYYWESVVTLRGDARR